MYDEGPAPLSADYPSISHYTDISLNF